MSAAYFGVDPIPARANDADQPMWTQEELDRLPYEFVPANDGSVDAEEVSAPQTPVAPVTPEV